MTNYKEIIRLHSLGLNKTRIAESCGCARSTVITALHKAEENGLSWNAVKKLSSEEVTRKLYPATSMGQQYSMPDYEWVHKEMQKSGCDLGDRIGDVCRRLVAVADLHDLAHMILSSSFLSAPPCFASGKSLDMPCKSIAFRLPQVNEQKRFCDIRHRISFRFV